jgi:hypothetical protein
VAILDRCPGCGESFGHSASDSRIFCQKCDGTEARHKKEEERWNLLDAHQKADELLKRIIALEEQSQWDGRIG